MKKLKTHSKINVSETLGGHSGSPKGFKKQVCDDFKTQGFRRGVVPGPECLKTRCKTTNSKKTHVLPRVQHP